MDTCQATLLQSSGRTQWRNWAPGFQRVFWTSKNKGKTKSHSSWALWFTLADYILNSRHPQLRMSEQMPLPIPASCTMAPASVSQIPERRRGIVSGVFRFGNVAFIHGASPTKIFPSKRKHSLELQVKNGTNLNQENTCKKNTAANSGPSAPLRMMVPAKMLQRKWLGGSPAKFNTHFEGSEIRSMKLVSDTLS